MSGAASVYRAALFAAVGDFDEDFFAYFEDVDLSFRGQLAGFAMLYEPSAVVYHRVGASSGGGMTPFSRHHFVKNSWFLFLKDVPAPLVWRYLPRFLFLQLGLLWGSARLGLLGAHARALLRVVAGGPAMLSRRRVDPARGGAHASRDRPHARARAAAGDPPRAPVGQSTRRERIALMDRARSPRRGTAPRSRREARSTAGRGRDGSPPSSRRGASRPRPRRARPRRPGAPTATHRRRARRSPSAPRRRSRRKACRSPTPRPAPCRRARAWWRAGRTRRGRRACRRRRRGDRAIARRASRRHARRRPAA